MVVVLPGRPKHGRADRNQSALVTGDTGLHRFSVDRNQSALVTASSDGYNAIWSEEPCDRVTGDRRTDRNQSALVTGDTGLHRFSVDRNQSALVTASSDGYNATWSSPRTATLRSGGC